MNSDSRILSARLDGVVWLRIRGKGSFKNSPDLKKFVDSCLADGESTFVIDLEDCTAMDSTFMGTITGVAIDLINRGNQEASVHVINASPRNTQLLQNLGLDQVLELDTEGTRWTAQREIISAIFAPRPDGVVESPEAAEVAPSDLDETDRARHVLKAHEALASAHAENAPRFRDVVDYFRKDLEKRTSH
ncbi:hypothetical protein BH23VER1_BH23VER1_06830 [soil metagenome]